MKNRTTFRFIIGLVCSASLLVAQQGGNSDTAFITNGLVAFYPLNGNVTNLVAGNSVSLLNGTGVFATTNRFGTSGGALHFSTGGYISLSPAPIDVSKPWTIAFWCTIDPSEQVDNFISNGHDLDNTLNLRYAFGGFFNVVDGVEVLDYRSTNDVTKWEQVVYTHSTNGYSILINGELIEARVWPSAPDTGVLWIGRQIVPTSSGFYDFKGNLDELRIYNRSLSATEVSSLYRFDSNPGSNTVVQHPATGVAHVTNGFVVGISITDPGFGYTNAPQVVFEGGGGSGAMATATVANGVVTAIKVINAGSGYTNAPIVEIAPPPYVPSQAFGVASVTNGFVTSVQVFDGGHDYPTAPSVFFLGGGGTGATATAILSNGVVSAVMVTSAGFGYTNAPTVLIAAPPGNPSVALKVSQVELDLTLIPGFQYQLQSSTDLLTWVNFGDVFLATSAEMTTNAVVAQSGQYFRILQVP